MEGIEKITENLQNTVTEKMEEVTKGFASKEEVSAQLEKAATKEEVEAKFEAQLEDSKQEKEALKVELDAAKKVADANKENVAKLDAAIIELKETHKKVEVKDNLNPIQSFAKKFAKKVHGIIKGEGVLRKTILKSDGEDVHIVNGNKDQDALDENVTGWFAQLLPEIITRKRSRADWVNAFSPVQLTGLELAKMAIKDNEALPTKVGECELKPTSRVDFDLYKRARCKVAEWMCFSDEFVITFRSLFDQILNILRNRVARAVPQTMITDIIAQSTDFQNLAATTLDQNTDNAVDAINEVVCQIEETTNCDIDAIHMKPRLYKALQNLKDANGRPLFSCCNGDSTMSIFGNITVYENNDLPDADGILFMDSSVVTVGYSDGIKFEDITGEESKKRNKTTYLVETWFATAIHPCEQSCVVYDTMSDIKQLLGL